jgi:hypothetical protein
MPSLLKQNALLLLALLVLASGPVAGEEGSSVASDVESLKQQVIRLNRDLFILEEDLLFPASTRFAVFLSVHTGQFLQLDSVRMKVDGDTVAAHLYTERQRKALEQGGMQRLYTGNLKSGPHDITVFAEGTGPDGRPYRKAASHRLDKGTGTVNLEIRIEDQSSDYQPAVQIVEWQ